MDSIRQKHVSKDRDLYAIMGIKREAIPAEVHKAYDILSKKCHPEYNYDPTELPIQTFSQSEYWQALNEAYEVLSDPTLRYIFDLYGEKGLQTGVCLAGWQTPVYTFSGDCTKIYSNFLANRETLLTKPKIPNADLILAMCNNDHPEVMHPVMVTLEERFHGAKKKVYYTRNIVRNGSVLSCNKDWYVEVYIPAGTPHATCLIKPGVGDIVDNTARDSMFVVLQLSHATFRASGHDLIMSQSVSLKMALLGGLLPVQTIDGRTLKIIMLPLASITSLADQQCPTLLIKGEGMPIPRSNRRGNLSIQLQAEDTLGRVLLSGVALWCANEIHIPRLRRHAY
ncbi:chaperone protein dnaJ 2 [Anopheles sinensis]|uniref:Chaperone protein dnaJ 2 n=1 Tax=Anopheles sinensis TaxID=74873 RepID=A0A084WMQ9_ANOSI|nr:chaperone protein dnaJ 2 [Anopheles sinensis]